ncbi:MAG: L-fuculose-phosphate aldolase [Anaerolineaceae bacterium]|nr:L-fuculose-phosphate aldolase [Anaerolineaceae bacterium]
MRLEKERKAIVEYGQKLIRAQLTTGTGGNLSIMNRAEGLVAIKPSGVDYFAMKPEDVVVVDMDGQKVEGRLKPSSEISFHLGLFKHRPDINAVVHTHQVYATTIACLNWELPAVHYLVGLAGNKVPVAPYATYGSKELSENILNTIGNYNACLMANHGLVTLGVNIAAAFAVAEELELVSRLYYQAKCIGEPAILSDDEMIPAMEKLNTGGNL